MIFPDKPGITLPPMGLNAVKGDWLAQPKPDGWRCVVIVGGDEVVYMSRHNKPLPVSDELRARWDKYLCAAFPVDTWIDGEWMERRPAAREERLWLFDLISVGGYTAVQFPASERYAMLARTLGPDHELLLPCKLTTSQADREAFWRAVAPGGPRHQPGWEGIVLKDPESRYIGNSRKCAQNMRWIKVKWRGGEMGCTPMI